MTSPVTFPLVSGLVLVPAALPLPLFQGRERKGKCRDFTCNSKCVKISLDYHTNQTKKKMKKKQNKKNKKYSER